MFRWFEVDELPQSRIFTDLKVCFNYNNPLLFRSFERPCCGELSTLLCLLLGSSDNSRAPTSRAVYRRTHRGPATVDRGVLLTLGPSPKQLEQTPSIDCNRYC